MQLDILIFAVITFLLILKLKSVLGTRNGNEPGFNEHFTLNEKQKEALKKVIELVPKTVVSVEIGADPLFDKSLIKGDEAKIEEGLKEIFEADNSFNMQDFIAGAKYAFEMIVIAYSKGNLRELKTLLSPKLYSGFEKAINEREQLGRKEETKIEKIVSAKITEAHLGGTMAYITVEYDVEKNTIVKDQEGTVIENTKDSAGDDTLDIWTFTRDIRTDDPNWILISTRVS